jgi:hypothetical protein
MIDLVFNWIMGLHEHWHRCQELNWPGLPASYPLPPRFFLGEETIMSSMEWIGANQQRHNYWFQAGCLDKIVTPEGSFDLWGIVSGQPCVFARNYHLFPRLTLPL